MWILDTLLAPTRFQLAMKKVSTHIHIRQWNYLPAVLCDGKRYFYRRKLIQKGLGKARVAIARKLGIRMWIMLRDRIEYNEFCRRGQMQQKSGEAYAGMPAARYGAKVTKLID